jgi:hypothetical protein
MTTALLQEREQRLLRERSRQIDAALNALRSTPLPPLLPLPQSQLYTEHDSDAATVVSTVASSKGRPVLSDMLQDAE